MTVCGPSTFCSSGPEKIVERTHGFPPKASQTNLLTLCVVDYANNYRIYLVEYDTVDNMAEREPYLYQFDDIFWLTVSGCLRFSLLL